MEVKRSKLFIFCENTHDVCYYYWCLLLCPTKLSFLEVCWIWHFEQKNTEFCIRSSSMLIAQLSLVLCCGSCLAAYLSNVWVLHLFCPPIQPPQNIFCNSVILEFGQILARSAKFQLCNDFVCPSNPRKEKSKMHFRERFNKHRHKQNVTRYHLFFYYHFFHSTFIYILNVS